jgi:nitroreductase
MRDRSVVVPGKRVTIDYSSVISSQSQTRGGAGGKLSDHIGRKVWRVKPVRKLNNDEKGGVMMDFTELLKARRSVRDFQDQAVPSALLDDIIRESCLAPSSGNRQPWRLSVVSDRALMKRLSDESKQNLVKRIEADPGFYARKYEAVLRDPDFNVFYNAPALVLVGAERTLPSIDVDCALFVAYLMFSAVNKGLGTCWINLGRDIRAPDLLETIGMPETIRIVAPVIVGYPAHLPAPPPRNEPQVLKRN